MANTSGRFIESTASILHTNCVSHLKFSGNNGLTDLSIRRPDRISFSDGPESNQIVDIPFIYLINKCGIFVPNSLRRKFVGILPAAADFCL